MTFRAFMTVIPGDVIWVLRAVKVWLVAGKTLHRGPGKLPIHVTGRATRFNVCTGQRELRLIVIKRGGSPGNCCMTARTVVVNLRRFMIGIVRALIIRLVAGETRRWCPGVLSADMALRA